MKAADFIKKLWGFLSTVSISSAPNKTKLKITTFKQIYKKN